MSGAVLATGLVAAKVRRHGPPPLAALSAVRGVTRAGGAAAGMAAEALDNLLPGLMRKHGIDLWCADAGVHRGSRVRRARPPPRRSRAPPTIYVSLTGAPPRRGARALVRRTHGLAARHQGAVFEDQALDTTADSNVAGGSRPSCGATRHVAGLKSVVEERRLALSASIDRPFLPARTALSSGELKGMTMRSGQVDSRSVCRRAALELIAVRLPTRRCFFRRMPGARLVAHPDDVSRRRSSDPAPRVQRPLCGGGASA